ncbi:MAG: hypothetical protein U5K00_09475 [Melioribacteraceae bacterium]|nr:hypothetical protein [Melioribacteraceae bacterium]
MNDYLPFTVGNWWLYILSTSNQMASEDIWWKGDIKWEVKDSTINRR